MAVEGLTTFESRPLSFGSPSEVTSCLRPFLLLLSVVASVAKLDRSDGKFGRFFDLLNLSSVARSCSTAPLGFASLFESEVAIVGILCFAPASKISFVRFSGPLVALILTSATVGLATLVDGWLKELRTCRELGTRVLPLFGGIAAGVVICEALRDCTDSLGASARAMFAILPALEFVVPFSSFEERAEPAGLEALVLFDGFFEADAGVETAVLELLVDTTSSGPSPVACGAASFVVLTDARSREYKPLIPPCISLAMLLLSFELDPAGGEVNSLKVVRASEREAELWIVFSA